MILLSLSNSLYSCPLDSNLQRDLAMLVRPRWYRANSHLVVLYDRTTPLNVTKRCMEKSEQRPSQIGAAIGLCFKKSQRVAKFKRGLKQCRSTLITTRTFRLIQALATRKWLVRRSCTSKRQRKKKLRFQPLPFHP